MQGCVQSLSFPASFSLLLSTWAEAFPQVLTGLHLRLQKASVKTHEPSLYGCQRQALAACLVAGTADQQAALGVNL